MTKSNIMTKQKCNILWLRTEMIYAIGKYHGTELLEKVLQLINEFEFRNKSDQPNGGDYAS